MKQTLDPNCECGHQWHPKRCMDERSGCTCESYRQVLSGAEQPYFECDTVFDYTPTPAPCDPTDPRHNSLAAPSPADDDRDAAGDVEMERSKSKAYRKWYANKERAYPFESGYEAGYADALAAERERTRTLVSALERIGLEAKSSTAVTHPVMVVDRIKRIISEALAQGEEQSK